MVVQRKRKISLQQKIASAEAKIRKMPEGPAKRNAKKELEVQKSRPGAHPELLRVSTKHFTHEQLDRLLTLIEKKKGKKLE